MSKLEKVLAGAALKIHKGFVIEKNVDPSKIDHTKVKNILLVIRHQMGDMLCAVPMMNSIRNFYPNAKVTLVTKKSTRFDEIFKDTISPVDEVRHYEYGFENFLNLAKELKNNDFDLAIVPSSVIFSATNHLLAYYSEAKYRVGAGSKDFEENKTGHLINIKNDFLWDSKKVHQIERNLDIIRQINISPLETKIRLALSGQSKSFADNFYNEHFPDSSKPVIGFHPGAAKEQNVWSAEKFAELAALLYRKYGAYIFISEGPADFKCVSEMEKCLREQHGITTYTKHKGELMNNTAIISRLSLFVTNDTGVMHLANGFEVPVIALFGPTKASEWGPIGNSKVAIQAAGENINNIDVSKVYETSMTLLSV